MSSLGDTVEGCMESLYYFSQLRWIHNWLRVQKNTQVIHLDLEFLNKDKWSEAIPSSMDLVKLHISEDNPFRHPATTGSLGSLTVDVIYKESFKMIIMKREKYNQIYGGKIS